MSDDLIAVRLYKDKRASHVESVFYKRSVIFDLTNQEILELVEDGYKLNYKLVAVSPQW